MSRRYARIKELLPGIFFGKDFTVEYDYKRQIVAITGSMSESS